MTHGEQQTARAACSASHRLHRPRGVLLRLAPILLLAFLPGGAGAAGPAGDPGLPPAECVQLLREARLAHRAGDEVGELETLRTARREFPDEIAVVFAFLEHQRNHGLPAEELARLQARLADRLGDPDRPLPPALLQRLALDPTADEALLHRVLDSVSSRLENGAEAPEPLLTVLADLQNRLGREEEAAETLHRLWRQTGDTEDAWALLLLESRLERPARALEVLESIEGLTEENWSLYIDLLVRAGRLDEALDVLEGRLEALAAPEGQASEEEIWPSEREGGFAAVPDEVTQMVRLAWSFRDAGRDAEAEALFRRALQYAPGLGRVRTALLHLYATEAEREEHAAGVDDYWSQAEDPNALLAEGTQRLATGDVEGAFDLLQRGAPHFPELEAPWFNLGMAAYRLERWPTAAEALGRAAELNPDRVASVYLRGVALTYLERWEEAVEALERALELDPDKVEVHYYLASCYGALGRPEEARRHRGLYEAGRED